VLIYAKAIVSTGIGVCVGISALSEAVKSDPSRDNSIKTTSESLIHAAVASEVHPRSDLEAASRVLRKNREPRPDNTPFNHTVPTTDQLRQIDVPAYMDARGHAVLEAVTGHFTGTTDEILQWGAYKWGFDPDLVRASAVDESHWNQNMVGDIGNGVSLGIMQIKSQYHLGTCPQSPQFPPAVDPTSVHSIQRYLASEPSCLAYNSTAFAVDYRLAYFRACMNKSITYLFNHEPVSGHSRYADASGDELLWGCLGSWYSGYFWDADSLDYIQRVLRFYAQKPWQETGF
jgi:autotransporter family porin